jgi:2-amino-4-hydroxy-6-hydroxymethyldihydropteridine diphosphokinase
MRRSALGNSVSLQRSPRYPSIDPKSDISTQHSDALLSLGANIGDRMATIARAVELISCSRGIELQSVSSMYETDPVGYLEQPAFINAAAAIRTTLTPRRLLGRVRAIERALGRRRRSRWHEREIDIDILLFGDLIVDEEDLHIPHREMHRRRFVLEPLAEIAREAWHPVLELTVASLLERCDDRSAVRRIDNTQQATSA